MVGGLATIALLVSGCGKSSAGKSTSSSTSQTVRTTSTGGPTTQNSTTSTSAANTVTGSSGAVTATLHAGTNKPVVGRPWPLRFTVTRGGQAAKAGVAYEYLFGGQVVAHRSHYHFNGHFSDIFRWPSSAVGYPLTFRAVIVSEGETVNLDYPVQVTG